MRILFCGDVVGRSGRQSILTHIPRLKKEFPLDMVIVNGENAASGFGITGKICAEFYEAGVDVITTGNHVWDQKEVLSYIGKDPHLLRPLNYPKDTPGNGACVVTLANGTKIAVINVMGQLFMPTLDDPFAALEEFFKKHVLGLTVNAIIIDIHAETTSEKAAIGHFVDGRATLVVGTHTHIPTADQRILPKGTAYQTDVGMCGDYNSIIGMEVQPSLYRFIKKRSSERLTPATGEATLCGVIVEVNKDGLAKSITPLRLGGTLDPTPLI